MSIEVCHKFTVVLYMMVSMNLSSLQAFVAAKGLTEKGIASSQDYTDKLVDNLFGRALTAQPSHHRDLDEATVLKEDDALAYANKDQAGWGHKKPDAPECDFSEKKMQISADWRLLSCTDQVSGELSHEVVVGIGNESEYTQEFEKAIGGEFQAGMEFAIGPLVKNKLITEGKRAFESAWMASVEHETADKVVCEVFGGDWCMWQWHMTFSQCNQIVQWDSPVTQCVKGVLPPPPLGTPVEVEKAEPSIQMPTLLHTTRRLSNSCLFVVMVLSMMIGSHVVLSLRRSGANRCT